MTILFIQALVGVLLFFVATSAKYIFKGRFKFKIWIGENKAYALWSMAMCVLAALIGWLEPSAIDTVFGEVGITVKRLENGELSGTLLGVTIALASKIIIKPTRDEV